MNKGQLKIILFGAILALLIFLSLTLVMNILIHDIPADYHYSVSVRGLDQYQGGPVTTITVPLPVRNGEQVFPESDLQDHQFGDWKSLIVVTKYGKMLAFQTMDRNLTDIDARFDTMFDHSITIENISQESFSPVMVPGQTNHTQWIYGTDQVAGFDTIIILDAELKPENPEENHPLKFDIELGAGEGMHLGIDGDRYHVTISEAIPGNVTGMVPVRTQIAKYSPGFQGSSDSWIPIIRS